MTRPALRFVALAATLLFAASPALPLTAQDGPQWRRGDGPTRGPVAVFPATHALALPTAQTIGAGEWMFEIAHRFQGTLDGGWDTFFGMDGGARMRIGLHWAPTSRVMIGVVRSNLDDNVDFGGKARLLERDGDLRLAVAVAGGIGWNTQVAAAPEGAETTQAHAELVLDVGVGERLGIGIVPGVVTNPDVRSVDEDAAFFLGTHARVELNDRVSLIGEWIASPERGPFTRDSGSFGLELETGGHFFKIFAGNSIRLNPTQAFVGSVNAFAARQLRLGFVITRLFRL